MAKPTSDKPRMRLRATPATDRALRGVDLTPSRQAPLFADPMPDRVEPCLAQLTDKPPVALHWAYEVKWDGYRVAIHIEPGRVRLLTRGGHDWTDRFPGIARAAESLGPATAILDGEAVVLDEQGISSFSALQQALGGRGGKRVVPEVVLYAFDLLYLDGRDLRALSLEERRSELVRVLSTAETGGVIGLSEEIEADGATFLAHACAMGLEGIIAKDRRKPYRSGRGGDWLKVKCVASDSFVIVGYEPSDAALGGLGSLLLARREGDRLVYIGNVGTGFTLASARALRKQLDGYRTERASVALRRKGVVWVQPRLVAEVAFTGWTADKMLRHPSYKGLRDEADR